MNRLGRRIYFQCRVDSLVFRVSWKVYSGKYEGSEGRMGVLQLFVLAEEEVIYGSWLKVYGSRFKE